MNRTTYAKTPGDSARMFTRPSWPATKAMQEDLNSCLLN